MQIKTLFVSTLLLVASINSVRSESVAVPAPTDSVPIPYAMAPLPSPFEDAAQYAIYIHRDLEKSGPAKQSPVTDPVPPKKRGFACSFPIHREHKMMIRCIGAGYFVYVDCTDDFRYTTEAITGLRRVIISCPGDSTPTGGGAYIP
ncbi:MAG: hypothetical protein J3Q66DRAFT_399650 [Benniella sp.]|nr:MAG: hypothetical protein J3Q66DRAFT_399650 [Benniella sp.]